MCAVACIPLAFGEGGVRVYAAELLYRRGAETDERLLAVLEIVKHSQLKGADVMRLDAGFFD